MPRKPEILAPAGQPAALEAAVAAGADAVYFGLKQLNARRGAENFAPDALAPTLRFLHDHHARGYLTLNIDLAQRELGQAARTLELARRAGADAVLVRDAALLPLLPLFPELEFHFSTQAAISSSAGVRAAAALGLRRVVLARELTLAEIRAASAVPGIETEAFVQGALCFSCSGRCLLSSWVGGRGGNRGACTSPCRVPWSIGGGAPEKPLSMHDLCALGHLAELAEAGVAALKIEGRLKQPAWVAQAVSLYRQALDHGATPELRAAADRLGAYTGRRLTAGYLEGNRANLTGDAGRPAGSAEPPTPTAEADTAPNTIRVTIAPDATGSLRWNFTAGTQSCELRTPPQPVRNPQRAVELHTLRDRFAAALPQPWRLAEFTVAGDPHRTLPRNRANQVEEELLKFLRRAGKTDDGTIRLDLPPATRAALQPPAAAPHPANTRTLGDPPDRVRLDLAQLAEFAAAAGPAPTPALLVECFTPADLDAARASLATAPRGATFTLIPTLPHVLYEAQIPALTALLHRCRGLALAVEVNSWDGWWLAKAANVTFEAGPGLMALNGNAATALHRLGCAAVTLSLEADRQQLEDACAAAAAPLSLTIFARPPLMQTRVELPAAAYAAGGASFRDARGVTLRPRREGAITAFRPTEPFTLCGLRNPALRVAHLVADLCASPDPVGEFRTLPSRRGGHRFNYERTLR